MDRIDPMIQAAFFQQEPDPWSIAGLNLAAGNPMMIQRTQKTPISKELFEDLSQRKTESLKAQKEGIEKFEKEVSKDVASMSPLIAALAGAKDIFTGSSDLNRVMSQQEQQRQNQLRNQVQLQNMRQSLTKEELDLLEKQFQNQSETERLKQQMSMFQQKLSATQPKDLKDTQVQSATYGKRIQQAEDVFGGLEREGYDRASLGEGLKDALSGFPGAGHLTSDSLKRQKQAEQNFVTATLRKESGAAISPSEFSTAEQQYFPRAGDTPEVLAQKRANRQQVLEGMKLGSGPAWEQLRQVPGADSDRQRKMQRLNELRKKAGGS
jgi:hypothetical protein